MRRAGLPHRWPDRLALVIATGLFSGYLPRMPGTWGSLLALLIGWGLIATGGAQLLNTVLALTLLIGFWAAWAFERWAGTHDAGMVTVDEFVGQWIALIPLAVAPGASLFGLGDWAGFALAFALFRAFDIWKPWPVSWADRLPGAAGVMLDDVIAGLYAGAVLALALRFL